MKSTRAMALIKTIQDLSKELIELVDTAPSIISETDRYLQDIDHILLIEKGKLTKSQYMAVVLERENVLSFRADTKRVSRLRTVVKNPTIFPSLKNLNTVMEHAELYCNQDNQTYTMRSETGLKLLQDIHVGKDLTKDKRYNLEIEVPLGQISSKSKGNRRRNGHKQLTKETVQKSKKRLAEVLYGYCEESIVLDNEPPKEEPKQVERTSMKGKLSIKEFLERANHTNQVEPLDKVDTQSTEETKLIEETKLTEHVDASGGDLQGKVSIQEYLDHATKSKEIKNTVKETNQVDVIIDEPTKEELKETFEQTITTRHATDEVVTRLVDHVKGEKINSFYKTNELRSVSEILSVNKLRYLVYAYSKTDNDTEFNQWVLDNEDDFTIYRAYAPVVENLNSIGYHLTKDETSGRPFAVYLEDNGTEIDIVDVALSIDDLNFIRDTHLSTQKIPSYS